MPITYEQEQLLTDQIETALDFCGSITEAIADFCADEGIDQAANQESIDAINFKAQQFYFKKAPVYFADHHPSPDCSHNPCDNCQGPADLELASCTDCKHFK